MQSSSEAMTTDAPPARRVLLLAGCFADAAASIDLAVAVATRTGARLEGVLALDPRAEAAGLVTVGHRGRSGPAPGGEALRLACAADARAFRRHLDVAAARASLRCDFRIGAGMLADLAFELRRPGDTVVLGHRRFLALRGPVVSLDRGAAGPAALLAADLARMLGLRVRLLPVDTLPSDIDLTTASAIVLPGTPPDNPRRLDLLLEAARCPVLLGASEPAPIPPGGHAPGSR